MLYLSEKEISKQESLTKNRLDVLVSSTKVSKRPLESLYELIHWVKNEFLKLNPNENWVPFIHNKISIDGSFITYCEENNIKLIPLFTDAITSWADDHDNEQFISAGIYNVSTKDISFYQCSLFHKGNQNEDEVSFFVFVKKEDVDKYLEIRNGYTKWQNERERNNQEIEVIGGEPIPYDCTLTWDDLFLPEELKTRIKDSVEGFLKSEETYKKYNVPYKLSMGFWGDAGTGKTTNLKVLMAQYPQLKPVTIQPGHPNPDELLEEAFAYAEEHSPALLFFEDLQELLPTVDMRHFLQLLDGVQKRDGILIVVTGNDFAEFEDNLTNRPGRMDKFFEFPVPDKDQVKKYLDKYFKEYISSKIITSIAKKAVKNKFTCAHLQELYFNSIFLAIPNGREVPSEDDINKSLEQVIEGKKLAENDFENVSSSNSLTDDF